MDSGEKTATLQNPKIYAAIAGVISDCGFVSKDKVNKQQGFKYRSVDDVFNALHPALAKNKVFIVPTILERKEEVIGQTAKGAKIIKVVCKIKFTFYGEDGSSFCSIIYGEGMDMGDKATNSDTDLDYIIDKEVNLLQYLEYKILQITSNSPTATYEMFMEDKDQY